MRPSSNPEVAFVLDKKRESRILNDAFNDDSFLLDQLFFDPHVPSSAPDTKIRFEQGAVYSSRPIELPSTGQKIYHPFTGDELSWPKHLRFYPNFEVRRKDLHFVQKATERILSERNIAKQVWNIITGRQRTATSLLLQVARATDQQQQIDKSLDYTSD